jgi:DNA-binding LacI/PurR family transcriptional regulator
MLFTATDPEDEIRQFKRMRDGADVDAFVLTSTVYRDPRTEWLIENRVPFVTFGRPWGIDDMNDPSHLWVDVDGWSGLRQATAHLLGEGAVRIAYLGWPSPSGTGDDRLRGWRDAMASSGLAERELDELRLSTEDGVGQGREAMRRMRESGIRFDAIVCASDSLALGALLAVGPDVPVIGYDNTPVAESVGLSSVEQPLDEVAAGALELIMGRSGSTLVDWNAGAPADAGPRHRLVTPRLILRHRSLL